MGSHPEVSALIEDLLAGVREALGDNLLGFYLRGSLALGDFDPETSDVDILVVTWLPVSEAEFEGLAALHARVPPAKDNEYRRRYEVSYIDRASIKRFGPGERRHPRCADDAPFGWAGHRPNWVLERWTVRERGVTLLGPDPKTLIDPVDAEEIRQAVRDELRERLRHWTDGSWPREDMLHRGAQAFEVETVCRALYTLATGGLPTKPQAVAWALVAVPERWRALIEWAREYRGDGTRDGAKIEDVMSLLEWAVSRVNDLE
jgi:predicted nucleotidyltransferase